MMQTKSINNCVRVITSSFIVLALTGCGRGTWQTAAQGTNASWRLIRTLPSTDLNTVTRWMAARDVNADRQHYEECTNFIMRFRTDAARWETLREELKDLGKPSVGILAFMDWLDATNDLQRAAAEERLRQSVTSNTWPFYAFVLYSPAHKAGCCPIIPPNELFSRVFDVSTVWDPTLLAFANMYIEFAGYALAITYWEEAARQRPVLRGAAVVHMMAAAQRLGDEARVLAILRDGLTEVKKAKWTIERAMQILSQLSSLDARQTSNELAQAAQ